MTPADTAGVAPLSARRERQATIAVGLQFAANGAFFASFMPRLPELRDAIGGTTQSVGVLLTVASASGLAASFTVRAAIALVGTRRALIGGAVALAAALAVVGAAEHWLAALLALAVMFFFDVYVDVAMNMQGAWLSARRSRPIMSRLHGLWSLGAVAGGLVASALADSSVSLRTHLTVAAAALAVLSVALGLRLLADDEPSGALPAAQPDALPGAQPDSLPGAQPGMHPGAAQATPPGAAARRQSRAASEALSTAQRVAFFAAGLSSVTVETAAIVWAAFRLTDDIGASSTAGALGYVGVVGGMTVARLTGDHLAERFSAERVLHGSALLSAAALTLAAVVPLAPLTVAAFLVAGFGIGALAPRLYDLAAHAGGGSAAGLAALTGGIRLATILVPIGGAAIAAVTTVGVAIAALAVPSTVAFVVALRHVGEIDIERLDRQA